MHDALDLRELLADEVVQQRESGHDVSGIEPEIRAALDGDAKLSEVEELYDRLLELPRGAGWPYEEPSTWPEIEALLPAGDPATPSGAVDDATLADRLRAAWLGRCAGCNLGKPVEGFTPEQIRRYLELAGAWPLDDYVPALDPMPEGLALRQCWTETTRGHISHMARDDDIDYTILALHILESHGFGFGTEDVVRHPLVQHKLSYLRDKDTPTVHFRKIANEVTLLLTYEATKDLADEEVEIETPLEHMTARRISGKKVAVCPILRAGVGMLDGVLSLIPGARVGTVDKFQGQEAVISITSLAASSAAASTSSRASITPSSRRGRRSCTSRRRRTRSACRTTARSALRPSSTITSRRRSSIS